MFTGWFVRGYKCCWTLHILQALTFGLKLVFAYQSGDECSVLLLPQFIWSSAASTTWIFGVYLVWLWPTEIHGATLKKLLYIMGSKVLDLSKRKSLAARN